LPILTLTGHYFASAAFGVQKILDMMVSPTGETNEKSLCAGEMTAHRRGASEH
jgi:hypothetical protein